MPPVTAGLSVVGHCESGSGVDQPHPALSATSAAADVKKVCHFVPFCAVPIWPVAHPVVKWHIGVPLVLSEVAHRVTEWHTGVPSRPGHGRVIGLELSAGECLSRAQSSTVVLLAQGPAEGHLRTIERRWGDRPRFPT